MKTKQISGVQPELLRWARETTGLSVAEVSIRLKRSEEEIRSKNKVYKNHQYMN